MNQRSRYPETARIDVSQQPETNLHRTCPPGLQHQTGLNRLPPQRQNQRSQNNAIQHPSRQHQLSRPGRLFLLLRRIRRQLKLLCSFLG